MIYGGVKIKMRKNKNHALIIAAGIMMFIVLAQTLAFATDYIKGYPATDISLNTWYSGVSGDSESNTPYLCFTTSSRSDSKYQIILRNKSQYKIVVNIWLYNPEYGWSTGWYGAPEADPYNTVTRTFSIEGSFKSNSKYCLQVWSAGLAGSGDRGDFEICVQEIVANTDNQKGSSISDTPSSESQPDNLAVVLPSEIMDLSAVKITKPKAAKKSATIKWKKISRKNLKKTKKVQVQVSPDPGFNYGVMTKNVSARKTSVKINKLKSKKKYYIRIRALNGDHVSKWSSVKSVKAK